jgi:deoxyribodipyrimidine photo-lyase
MSLILHNQGSLSDLHIPLQTITHTPRRTLPQRVMEFMNSINATHLYANMEYEVDELRRDIRTCQLARESRIHVSITHDKLLVKPGTLSTQQGKPYTVSGCTRVTLDQFLTKHKGL